MPATNARADLFATARRAIDRGFTLAVGQILWPELCCVAASGPGLFGRWYVRVCQSLGLLAGRPRGLGLNLRGSI